MNAFRSFFILSLIVLTFSSSSHAMPVSETEPGDGSEPLTTVALTGDCPDSIHEASKFRPIRGTLKFFFKGKRKWVTIPVGVVIAAGLVADVALYEFKPDVHPLQTAEGTTSVVLRSWEFIRDDATTWRAGNEFPLNPDEELYGGRGEVLTDYEDLMSLQRAVARDVQAELDAAYQNDVSESDSGS